MSTDPEPTWGGVDVWKGGARWAGTYAPPGPVWPEPSLPPVWPPGANWPDWPPYAYWPSGPFGPVPWREGYSCPGPTWDFCQWARWESTFMSTVIPLWSGPSPYYPPWWFRTWGGRPVPLEGAPGDPPTGGDRTGWPSPPTGVAVHTTGERVGEGVTPTIAQIAQPRYADPEDLARVGLTHRALLGTAEDTQETALLYASRLADSYLGVRYRIPFRRWGDDLRLNVAKLAAWTIMSARGYDPSTPNDQAVLRTEWEDAIAWLQQIATRKAVLAPPLDAGPGGPGGPWGPGGGWGWPPLLWGGGGPRCLVF